MKILASFLSIAFLITAIILCSLWFFGNKSENFLNNKLIDHGVGWKNNKSFYAGSEMNFIFSNSKSVTIEVSTNSKADQGIEVFIDDKTYLLPSSIKQSEKLSVKVDKNKFHSVTIRHFCTYLYYPCEVTLDSIFLDGLAKLFPYQHHKMILSILGDSISTIYGVNNYSQLTANSLKYELHNSSIMGSTVSVVRGVDSASLRYKKDLMSFKSNTIIIFMGTNDVGSNVQLGEFEKSYSDIVANLKLHNPQSKLFLVGILPRNDINYTTILQYNEVIRNIALNQNAQYVDISNVLNETDFSDSIHPSIDGQKKIAVFLKGILSSILN